MSMQYILGANIIMLERSKQLYF